MLKYFNQNIDPLAELLRPFVPGEFISIVDNNPDLPKILYRQRKIITIVNLSPDKDRTVIVRGARPFFYSPSEKDEYRFSFRCKLCDSRLFSKSRVQILDVPGYFLSFLEKVFLRHLRSCPALLEDRIRVIRV